MAAQVLSLIIFFVMFGLVITEKFERHISALGCGVLMFIIVLGICMRSPEAMLNTLNIKNIFTVGFWYEAGESAESSGGINWATIIFIFGMMVMVEGMGQSGFFKWLCIRLSKAVHYQVVPIFIVFMILSAMLAVFIDSITVILFLAAATVELSRMLEFNPVPMILSGIFCANLGGSATMCGDPPNIIIGTSLGYTFSEFITNTGLMAGISLIFAIVYFYICFRKELQPNNGEKVDIKDFPDPKKAITSKKRFLCSTIIFICAIILLATHAQTGLTVALIGVIIAAVTLVTSVGHIKEIFAKVDFKTLLFFIGLFMVVGGLEQIGILEVIADFIEKVSGGNNMLIVVIIIWVSAIASAFVDNIPFAATMIPIIKSLAETSGMGLPVLAWTLSMGTDIGGSATPIGASANVVGTSVAAKAGYPIGWREYCKKLAPITAIVILISMITIFVRYF
ncbi:MAG: citrate transporter [Clostridiales bacterium]|nr:citrate transporter [Clostridiales bacterium]